MNYILLCSCTVQSFFISVKVYCKKKKLFLSEGVIKNVFTSKLIYFESYTLEYYNNVPIQ